MKYGYFGSTGLRMSRIAFGVQTFGWSVEDKDAFNMLDYYHDQGGNYIDIADSYNNGRAEEITGSWLKNNPSREDIIVGTKVFFPTGSGENQRGLSRKHIIQSVETSLKRLNTDYIDLYQLHCFDRMTPIEEITNTMNILINTGKIRHYGLSNYTASAITENIYTASDAGLIKPSSVQLEYSLLVRSSEWELIPVCSRYHLGILAWSPLSGGWLTGKYRRNKNLPEDSRAGIGDRWDDNEEQRGGSKTFDIIEKLINISAELQCTPSQLSLAWMLNRKEEVFPLIGARTTEQLCGNLKAVDIELTDGHIAELNSISAVDAPYPYNFISRYTRHE